MSAIIVNQRGKLARMEQTCNAIRSEQLDVQRAALSQAITAGDDDTAAMIARNIRNRLLRDSDAEVALDRLGLTVPAGTTFTAWLAFFRQLGEMLIGGWATYRQALRDLPTSGGWPLNIVWPVAPDGGGADEQSTALHGIVSADSGLEATRDGLLADIERSI